MPLSRQTALGSAFFAMGRAQQRGVATTTTTMTAATDATHNVATSAAAAALAEDFNATRAEYLVNMVCPKCEKRVREAFADQTDPAAGPVYEIACDVDAQLVTMASTLSTDDVIRVIEDEAGLDCRLIGITGYTPGEDSMASAQAKGFAVPAAVAEFKGAYMGGAFQEGIVGVVQFVQLDEGVCRVEAALAAEERGGDPGADKGDFYEVEVREYGDISQGVANTGGVYGGGPLGRAEFKKSGTKNRTERRAEGMEHDNPTFKFRGDRVEGLDCHDLVGRAVVVRRVSGSDGTTVLREAAAVIARKAGLGQNYKRTCACDGTVIWQS